MSFFPFQRVSDFFAAEGDFAENLEEAEESVDTEAFHVAMAVQDEVTQTLYNTM